MDLPAERLSAHLDSLNREVERLDQILMLDANWRALKQLEAREAGGEALVAVDAAALRASLLNALSGSRIYAARLKLVETMSLLSGATAAEQTGAVVPQMQVSLADRMVLLDGAPRETFRTRIRARAKALPMASAPPAAETTAPAGQVVEPTPVVSASFETLSSSAVQEASPLAAPDALELIEGLSRPAVEMLRDHDVNRFDDIVKWTAADVAKWRIRLDGLVTGEPGSWIEQAALLETGARTRYAQRARSGDFTALVPLPEPLQLPSPNLQQGVTAGETVPAGPHDPSVARAQDAIQPEDIDAAIDTAVGDEIGTGSDIGDGCAGNGEAADLQAMFDMLALDDAPLEVAEAPDPAPPQADPSEPAQPGDRFTPPRTSSEPSRSLTRALEQFQPHPAGFGDSDVVVIKRELPPPSDVISTPARPKPQKLLRRLKQALAQDKFEADGYAAYRAVVEEASVTIVRPDETRVRAAGATGAGEAMGPAHNKFLKALTGGD